MQIIPLYILLFLYGCCSGMKEDQSFTGGFGDIFIDDNKPQSVTVITSDEKTIEIEPEIVRCMASLIDLKGDKEEQPLTLIDSATLNIIIAILKEQKIKPFADIIRECKEENEQLLRDYKSTVEQASEQLNKKETFEQAKTELKAPQELNTFLSTINSQGKLIKKLNAFSFERNAVEKICQTLNFTQILLLIRATSILGIPFLDDVLVTIAATKKVNITDIMNNTVDFLDQKYINNILHQKLFAIKEELSVDIYPSAQVVTRNPITGGFEMSQPITMRFSPQGKYFIYQSFGTKGWIFKERVPVIVFWDCEKKRKVHVITDKHIGTTYYSPDQKYFSLIYPDWLRVNVATYDSNTLKVRPNIKDPFAPIKFIQKNIYIFDAEDTAFPLKGRISQPFFTGEQIKMTWDSGKNINLNEEQKKNEDKVVVSLFSDPYEGHNVNKKLLLSMTKKYITINSTEDFSCVKIIPALIDEREFDIEKVAFSPSGKYLAACGKIPFPTRSGAIWKPTLKIWATSDWSCVGTIIDEKNALLKERANTFSALSFSPDDSMIAVSNSYKKEVYFCGPLNLPNISLAQLNYCIYQMQENANVDERLKGLYDSLPDIIKNDLKKPSFIKSFEQKFSEQLPEHLKKFTSVPQTNGLLTKALRSVAIAKDDFPIKKAIYPRELEEEVDKYKANLSGSKSAKLLLNRAKQQKK